MKKLIAAGALALALTLSACSGAPAPTVTVTETQTAAPAPTVTVTPSPEQTLPDVVNRTRAGQGTMTDAEFTKFVHDARPVMATTDAPALVGLVDSACNAFDRGASKAQIIKAIVGSVTNKEVGGGIAFTIGAGVRIYCPEHAAKLEG